MVTPMFTRTMTMPTMPTRRAAMTILAGAAVAAGFAAAPAQAHNPQAKHGGRIVLAGSYHVELVIEGATVAVYLLGHDDKPRDAAGHQGVAILVVDGKSQRVPLAVVADNRLEGKATASLPADVKGVVQITAPTGATAQAKFN